MTILKTGRESPGSPDPARKKLYNTAQDPRPRHGGNMRRADPIPPWPYVTARDSGMPIYMRITPVVRDTLKRICPHGPEWSWIATAREQLPPCMSKMAENRGRGCPTSQEFKCFLEIHKTIRSATIEVPVYDARGSYLRHEALGESRPEILSCMETPDEIPF